MSASNNTNKNSKQKKTSQRTVQIIAFIRNYTEQHGYSPSVREIGSAVGLSSTSSVQGYLDRLEKEGIIERREDRPRTIKIISGDYRVQEQSNMTVPIVKQLMFDGQMYDSSNIVGYRSIPQEKLPESDVYVYYEVKSSQDLTDCDKIGVMEHDLVLLRIGAIDEGVCQALVRCRTHNDHDTYGVQRLDNRVKEFDSKNAAILARRLVKARNRNEMSVIQTINNMFIEEHVSISEGQYLSWEKGHEYPNTFFIKALSNVLRVSSDWLLGQSDDMGINDNIHIVGEVIGLSRSFK